MTSKDEMREKYPMGARIKVGPGDETDEFFRVVGHTGEGVYVVEETHPRQLKPNNIKFIKLEVHGSSAGGGGTPP